MQVSEEGAVEKEYSRILEKLTLDEDLNSVESGLLRRKPMELFRQTADELSRLMNFTTYIYTSTKHATYNNTNYACTYIYIYTCQKLSTIYLYTP